MKRNFVSQADIERGRIAARERAELPSVSEPVVSEWWNAYFGCWFHIREFANGMRTKTRVRGDLATGPLTVVPHSTCRF